MTKQTWFVIGNKASKVIYSIWKWPRWETEKKTKTSQPHKMAPFQGAPRSFISWLQSQKPRGAPARVSQPHYPSIPLRPASPVLTSETKVTCVAQEKKKNTGGQPPFNSRLNRTSQTNELPNPHQNQYGEISSHVALPVSASCESPL